MKNVLSKLATARLFIKSHPIKKDGRNAFSKYDYFTPEIISKLVNDACIEADIICVFSLKQDALGFYGEVSTTDLETGETLVTEMRTAKPLITATNETQQMGGMNTYTKRYAFMSLFDIEDNAIDFDSQDNTPKTKSAESFNNAPAENELPWLNENTKEFAGAIEKMRLGKSSIEALRKHFKISKKVEEKLSTEASKITA
jgi:ERF superfamily